MSICGLRRSVSALIIAAAAFVLVRSARADAIEDFYRGRSINIVIGYGVGGGYDTYARLLSHHLGKHIPGNPSMVPQNMPGAGGLRPRNISMGSRRRTARRSAPWREASR